MRITRWAALAATVLLAFSCNNSFGIFETIQNETKQNGTKVFQKTMVKGAFRLGDYYYATTSTLNRRAVSDSTWSKVDIGGLSKYSILNSAVLVGDASTGSIYVLLEVDSTRGIWRSTTTDGASWEKLSVDASKYTALFSANGQLYAESMTTDSATTFRTYRLYYCDIAAATPAFVLVDGGDHLFLPAVSAEYSGDKTIRGVVYDEVNSKYWFASEDFLYSGTSADGSDATNAVSSFTDLSSKTIWAISYTGGSSGHVYIATTDSYLYESDQAAPSSVHDSMPFSKVIQVPIGTGTELLVGTDTNDVDTAAVGYYEGSFDSMAVGGDSDGGVSKTAAVYTNTVSIFPVEDFYYDQTSGTTGTLFICVAPGTTSSNYYGLYSSKWDGSSWSGWSAE
jgi:hypothetical protein